MSARSLTRVRKLCLALPEAHEVEAWSAPTFRVRNKMFAMFAKVTMNHRGFERPAVWIKAAPGDKDRLVETAPEFYFSPPYMGASGWVGIWLDNNPDWTNVGEFLRDGYRLIAPKRLCAVLDAEE